MLLYNLAADKLSKTEYHRTEYAWNAMMYQMYAVSRDTMNLVYAYTNCLPIGMDLSLRQLSFLLNCCEINNYVVKFVLEYFGHPDVYDCIDGLGISSLDVYRLSSESAMGVVRHRFICGATVNQFWVVH